MDPLNECALVTTVRVSYQENVLFFCTDSRHNVLPDSIRRLQEWAIGSGCPQSQDIDCPNEIGCGRESVPLQVQVGSQWEQSWSCFPKCWLYKSKEPSTPKGWGSTYTVSKTFLVLTLLISLRTCTRASPT